MRLWLVLTIMTSVAAVLLSAPFIRRTDRPRADTVGDIEVYRDQLEEIENELRQGLIDDAQAAAARIEIKKQALTASKSGQCAMPTLSQNERNFAMICVAAIVVLGSTALYAITGNPDLPSVGGFVATQAKSFAASHQPSSFEVADAQTSGSESLLDQRPQAGLPPVEDMIERLAARLARSPKDPEGWRTLGWSYASTGRFSEAGQAYAKAIELNPDMAEIRSARVEALVRAAGGSVTTEAKKAIEDTLRLEPKDVRARFFKGLAKEQQGDKTSALTDWIELLHDANSDEPWVLDLQNRIVQLERNLGVDPAPTASGLPELQEAEGETHRAIDKGPSPDDLRRAEGVLPAERSAMIRGMVGGLSNRLEQSPRDADGWIKLIRSRMVLGESNLAMQALRRSLEVFADDPPERDRIAAAAQQLGLGQ
jgi:cytochrome c-type biogenesis protein CcmH